ncbi:diguanylate cyclase [Massilia sp. KIM]|nr:diguanylate cyclase [Massilia sp. KIM]
MPPPDTHDPQISQLAAKRKPAARLAALVLLTFCMLLAGLQVADAWRARDKRLHAAAVANSNMVHALAAQGESAIRITDTVLASVVEQVEHEGWSGEAGARLQNHLRNMVREVEELHGLLIYDAEGNWVLNSLDKPMKGNNADREYFRYHRSHPDRGAHVGPPVLSRSTGAWVLPISRRINHPDGSFAGVAVATIQIAYFARLYDAFDVGRDGTILLALDDGTLAYRRPFNEKLIGETIAPGSVYQTYRQVGAVGSATLRGRMDGVLRLYSFRRMGGYPLLVVAGVSRDEVLAEWRASTTILVGGSVLVVLLLAAVGVRLVRQIMIRDSLEQELMSARERLQERNEILTELAERDGLTGISNRRHFEETLQLEIGRAARTGRPISLIILDVDNFKKYNDRYGHVAGDDCLRRVAAALPGSLARPSDFPARYGGEEFVILLPETGASGAAHVAEKVRLAVMECELAHADNCPGVVTVSLGVFTTLIDAAAPPSGAALVAQADQLLYRAKQLGRNRAVSTLEDEPLAAQA